jgi:hypothetical protein
MFKHRNSCFLGFVYPLDKTLSIDNCNRLIINVLCGVGENPSSSAILYILLITNRLQFSGDKIECHLWHS